MKKRNTVVTGLGIISPYGTNAAQFWNKCMNHSLCAVPVPKHWSGYAEFSTKFYAPLPTVDTGDCLCKVEKLQLDCCQQLGIAASLQALTAAGFTIIHEENRKNTFSISSIDSSRTGVYIGTGSGGISSLIDAQAFHATTPARFSIHKLQNETVSDNHVGLLSNMEKSLRVPMRFNPFTVSMMMPNACSSSIGIKFSLKGPNETFCFACASGTIAVGHALRAVSEGRIDCAICGGVEFLKDSFGGICRSFDIAGALAKGNGVETFCPFDKKRDGFLFSEGGAAVLILEEEEHALRRNAPILARITGFAEKFDPYGTIAMEPGGVVIEEMLKELLNEASLRPGDIDYINTHGTGTVANDDIESAIIERLFGDKTPLNSTKSLIGHTMGASGAIEAGVCILSILYRATHGCLHLKDPVRPLNFIKFPRSLRINRALSQSFAFGGHVAALLFEEYNG